MQRDMFDPRFRYVIRRRQLVFRVLLDHDDTHAVLLSAERLTQDPVPDIATVLDLLRSLVECRSVSFNDMVLATGDFRYLISPPDEAGLAQRLKPQYDRYVHQHPLVAESQRLRVQTALRFCDVPGGDEFTATDLYREFFKPFGLRYQLAIALPAPPGVVVGYALNRTSAQGEFANRDLAVINALRGHLSMHHRLAVDRDRSNAMAGAAGSDGWAVLTVRSDGRVEASSSPEIAAQLAPDGQLPPEVTALIPREGDYRRLVDTHDLTVASQRWRCVLHAGAIAPTVLLVRKVDNETQDTTPLVDLGLTPRQIEVALALSLTGGTNAQLASELAISEGTLKKHLESVFRVLGVTSRGAAVVALRTITQPNL